jgi:hypothetical protein
MSKNSELIAFLGHHKASTTWISDIMLQVCRDSGLRFVHIREHDTLNGTTLLEYVHKRRGDYASYINSDWDDVKLLRSFKAFHVIRDPRDIVVSAYFSHHYSHPTRRWPELNEYRAKLAAISKEDGLYLEIDREEKLFSEMSNWHYDSPNILELKMEDLTQSPYEYFLTICEFLGILNKSSLLYPERIFYPMIMLKNRLYAKAKKLLPLPRLKGRIIAERLLGIVHENRFSKKADGRKPGQEDETSHYRRGVPGDWKNHFGEEHKAYFKQKYKGLLIQLGYENDINW